MKEVLKLPGRLDGAGSGERERRNVLVRDDAGLAGVGVIGCVGGCQERCAIPVKKSFRD